MPTLRWVPPSPSSTLWRRESGTSNELLWLIRSPQQLAPLTLESQQEVVFYVKNGPTPASFRLFSVFSNKHQYNFYNKLNWKNVNPSSIRHRDSNPRPFKHESSPITTRPGLPPQNKKFTFIFFTKKWPFTASFSSFSSFQLSWQKYKLPIAGFEPHTSGA